MTAETGARDAARKALDYLGRVVDGAEAANPARVQAAENILHYVARLVEAPEPHPPAVVPVPILSSDRPVCPWCGEQLGLVEVVWDEPNRVGGPRGMSCFRCQKPIKPVAGGAWAKDGRPAG